jgi:hypothetical protein
MPGNETPDVRLYFRDADGTQQVVSSRQLEFDEIQFARTEPLPDPATLTIGEMIDLVTQCAGLFPMISHPVHNMQWVRRDKVLRHSPAFREFMGWVQRKVPLEENGRFDMGRASATFRDRLSKRLDKSHPEIKMLPALGAVAILDSESQDAGAANVARESKEGDSDIEVPAARPKILRGQLDESAAILQTKNPAFTYEQLASTLGCTAGALRKKAKYPLLAAARARIKAQRLEFNANWRDRQSCDNDD